MPNVINATSTGNGGLISQGDDSGILNIQTNETTAITVDASQRVAFVAGTAALPAITTTGDTNTGIFFPAADTIAFSEGGAESMRIDSSGNVGIGGTPSKKLQVTSSDVTDGIRLYSSDTSGEGLSLEWMSAFGSNRITADIESDASGGGGNFAIRVADTSAVLQTRLLIDNSGNLLVGTTSTFSPGGVPTTTGFSTNTAGNWALGIRNTTTASNPFGLAIQYPNGAPNSGSAQFIFCQDNAGTKFDVRSNGGIGNYSANNANLSDQREKKNIQLAPNYLDKICQIPVKTFLFNDQTDTDLNLGSIAQDVQAVCPELITESNWGTEEEPKMRLSIYQTDLQYALMKSIQELKAINDTQAETINALTARIVALEQA